LLQALLLLSIQIRLFHSFVCCTWTRIDTARLACSLNSESTAGLMNLICRHAFCGLRTRVGLNLRQAIDTFLTTGVGQPCDCGYGSSVLAGHTILRRPRFTASSLSGYDPTPTWISLSASVLCSSYGPLSVYDQRRSGVHTIFLRSPMCTSLLPEPYTPIESV